MKKVLITGANSYIGTSFEKYLSNNFSEQYQIDTLDMISDEWRKEDFSKYDSVFHVAGIAHSDNGKISDERSKLYYSVNTDLAIDTAIKAKNSGVKQFIFMSSAIVYGDSAPIGKTKVITRSTPTSPSNCYGDSKVQAEKGILPLSDDSFNIVIIRAPMIYGKGCKGNYRLLSKIAQITPFFPKIKNQRSMLYIENLCEFVRLMIVNNESGIFWPQNDEYVNTSDLVKMISEAHGKKTLLLRGFSSLFKLLSHVTALVNKAFGNLCYEKSISRYRFNYNIFGFYGSVVTSEGESKGNE